MPWIAPTQKTLAIEDTLDTGLPPVCMSEVYQAKCSTLFEHVYETYPKKNAGVFANAN